MSVERSGSAVLRGWEQRRSVRFVAMSVVAVLGLTVGELSVPSSASAGVVAKPKAVAEKVLSRPDVVSASISARSQGARVEVEGARTETTSTFVNPDGTFTTEAFGGPVRTRGVDGAWHELDFDLAFGPDGSVSPGVHPAGLRLSGGSPKGFKAGSGGVSDVVSVVQSPVQGVAGDVGVAERDAKKTAAGKGVKAGKSGKGGKPGPGVGVDGVALVGARVAAAEKLRVSFGWAGVLPKPVLSGTTATYREVQPGVDLVVKVLRTGYEQFFVIRTPAGLKALQSAGGAKGVSWELPITAPGMNARLGADGAVELVDAQGKTPWRYAAPLAWDAKIDPHSGEPVSSAPVKLGLSTASAGHASVSVTPDAKWLADPKRVFPITVDPYAGATGWSSFDTTVQSNVVNTDMSTDTELKVGTYDGGTTKARAFINFPLAVFKGKKIMSANLYPVETHSWSCTPSEVLLFETAAVSTATRWSNQPGSTTAQSAPYGRLSAAKGYSSSCPAGRVSIPMTTLAQKWADNTATSGTLRLSATDETASNGWKKFASREATTTGVPQIAFTYNRPPNAAVAPAAKVVFPYSPAGSSVVSNYVDTLKPTFVSRASDPDGTTVRLTTEVHTSTTTSSTTLAASCVTAFVASGADGSCTLGTALADSKAYYARTSVFDGTTWNGTWSPWYTFKTAAATTPSAQAKISCPSPYNVTGTWTTTAPTAAVTCTVSAAPTVSGTAAPGYIDIYVDGKRVPPALGDPGVKIVPSTDPAVAKTTVTVPNTEGGHQITARSVMVTAKVGTTQTYEFGYGNKVNVTKPAPGTRPTVWGPIAIAGVGSPKGASTAPTAKTQWRVAGDSAAPWVDGAALTATPSDPNKATTSAVNVVGSFDVRSATQSGVVTLNPRIPVLLEIRPCISYSTKPMECAATPTQVLRVPHAFGNGFPTTDVGAGQVALFTGEFNTDTTDVSVPGYTGDLTLSRSHTTYGNDPAADTDITTGVFGPGWTANIDGGDAGSAGVQVVDSTRIDGTIALVDADGAALVYKTPTGTRRTVAGLTAGTYSPANDDTALDGSKLVVGDYLTFDAARTAVSGTDGVLDVRLTEKDGTVTTFAGLATPTAAANGTFSPVRCPSREHLGGTRSPPTPQAGSPASWRRCRPACSPARPWSRVAGR